MPVGSAGTGVRRAVPAFAVVIPWRPQPSRLAAYAALRAWYKREFPEAPVRAVDAGGPAFHLAASRNNGVQVAPARTVVVLNDADTIPDRTALLGAVTAAAGSPLVHLPYREYRWLGPLGTAEYRSGTPLDDCAAEIVHGACSGVYVTTPETWWSHGGQDERFEGWGYEDEAWRIAHETLLGAPPVRHAGRVYALDHEPEPRHGTRFDANAALMARYRAASSDAGAMTRLLRRPEPDSAA